MAALKTWKKPDFKSLVDAHLDEKLRQWFADRRIPVEVLQRHNLELRTGYFPDTRKQELAIAFPYFRGGEVVNVKYRKVAEKSFRMESGCELVLYGLDDIESDEPLIWVEGEIDKLSLEVAGFPNCVSVPNGAGTNLDQVLASAEGIISSVERFILAGDSDVAGRKLQAELIRRLGPEKCYRVTWPENCKDANDVLCKYDAQHLAFCIEQASPVPIDGAFEINDIATDIFDLYDHGRPRGEHPGWNKLNEHYRPRAGDWTVVTGTPGSGKSCVVAALMVNLARDAGWQFVVFPPENCPPQEYASMLMEIWAGMPFNDGPSERMSRRDVQFAMEFVHNHFVILDPAEGQRDLDGLLKLAKAYVYRRGIQGFVIDPWNELEGFQPGGQTETQYIGQCLIKLRNFSRHHRVHSWVVVHPTKLHKNENGKYPVPTLYDCSGSAHWFNKADCGLSIWRDKSDDSLPVQIHIQKIRFRWCGQIGMIELYYDKVTGRYSERSEGDRQNYRGYHAYSDT